MNNNLIIKNARIITPLGTSALKGKEMNRLLDLTGGTVVVTDGVITYAGPSHPSYEEPKEDYEILDAGGRVLLPGFIDSHTHLVFGGYRPEEFVWRMNGESYMSIMQRGGGIINTVHATREATPEELKCKAEWFIDVMSRMGVTTVEGKSGYGLDRDTELKQLEVMRSINLSPQRKVDIAATFLGAHALPPPFGAKIHADEIVSFGGAELAGEIRALSADHLLHASDNGIRAMAENKVVATLLPLTAFTLREPYARGRDMIDCGCAVALATDLNPGSCCSGSIPLTFALACLYMHLTLEEAITAMTLNGAAALGYAHRTGSIEVGKQGDLVLLDTDTPAVLVYYTGMNSVQHTIKAGRILF